MNLEQQLAALCNNTGELLRVLSSLPEDFLRSVALGNALAERSLLRRFRADWNEFSEVTDEDVRRRMREAQEAGDLGQACIASRALGMLESPDYYPCDSQGRENPHVRAAWSISSFEARLLCAKAILDARAMRDAEQEAESDGN